MKVVVTHSILLLLLCFSISQCGAWNIGDIIPVAVTTLYKGQRTSPRELLHQHSPRFGVNRIVQVASLDDGLVDDDVKILLELGQNLGWRTSWITLRSTACSDPASLVPCLYVREIHMEFHYEKNVYGRITSWNYEVEYSEHKQQHVSLHYKWHHVAEYDMNLSMATLCGVCALSLIWMTYRIAVTSRSAFVFTRQNEVETAKNL
eukprot:PhF_6_TR6269/c0_g1_i1/m.9487